MFVITFAVTFEIAVALACSLPRGGGNNVTGSLSLPPSLCLFSHSLLARSLCRPPPPVLLSVPPSPCLFRSGRRGGRGERREASVGGANYKTVGSALLVAEMSVGFLQFAAHFPAIVTDVLTRLGELLRVGFVRYEKGGGGGVDFIWR